MTTSPARTLDADEAATLAAELRAQVVTGTWVMDGDPLRRDDWDVAVTEPMLWDGREALSRVLGQTGETAVFALGYQVDDGCRFTHGFEIPVRLTEDEFAELAEGADVGFGISGAQFYLFDASMRWVIVTALDVQLTAGEPQLVEAFFGSGEARAEAEEDYRLFASQPGILPVYAEMAALNQPPAGGDPPR